MGNLIRVIRDNFFCASAVDDRRCRILDIFPTYSTFSKFRLANITFRSPIEFTSRFIHFITTKLWAFPILHILCCLSKWSIMIVSTMSMFISRMQKVVIFTYRFNRILYIFKPLVKGNIFRALSLIFIFWCTQQICFNSCLVVLGAHPCYSRFIEFVSCLFDRGTMFI